MAAQFRNNGIKTPEDLEHEHPDYLQFVFNDILNGDPRGKSFYVGEHSWCQGFHLPWILTVAKKHYNVEEYTMFLYISDLFQSGVIDVARQDSTKRSVLKSRAKPLINGWEYEHTYYVTYSREPTEEQQKKIIATVAESLRREGNELYCWSRFFIPHKKLPLLKRQAPLPTKSCVKTIDDSDFLYTLEVR